MHVECQESNESDPCQGKLQKDLDYAHIPMYAVLVVKPLWPHTLGGIYYSRFHHSRWITLCMAFTCPATDSLDPMDHFLSFNVSLIIPTNLWKIIYAPFNLIIVYIHGYYTYSRVHRDVWIIQILLERSLTWIWLIWLLAFHMPWDRTDFTFQYPFEKLYKEPLETLKS